MLVCFLSFTFLYVFITCIAAFVRNKLMMMMIVTIGLGCTVWPQCTRVTTNDQRPTNQRPTNQPTNQRPTTSRHSLSQLENNMPQWQARWHVESRAPTIWIRPRRQPEFHINAPKDLGRSFTDFRAVFAVR